MSGDKGREYDESEGLASFLNGFDLDRFDSEADKFLAMDFGRVSDSALRDAYYDLIAPTGRAAVPQLTTIIPERTPFWRVRAAGPDRNEIAVAADMWWPPANLVGAPGRLNAAHESLLYTCPEDPALAVSEARIAPGQEFFLIRYVAKRPIRLTQIPGPLPGSSNLSTQPLRAYEQIYAFHRRLFSFVAVEGDPAAYRVSEFLAKEIFDLPPDVQDGWCYPSIQQPPALNTAFRGSSYFRWG